MSDDSIIYNGVSMTRDWPERIRAAQQVTTVTIGGKTHPRIRYGEEQRDYGADQGACRDRGVMKFQFHVPQCDVERCPRCGGQMISCDCGDQEFAWPAGHHEVACRTSLRIRCKPDRQ